MAWIIQLCCFKATLKHSRGGSSSHKNYGPAIIIATAKSLPLSFWHYLTISLVVSLNVSHRYLLDARRWDYSFTPATPDQAITFSDGNEIRGTITSPNYPGSFTTMGSSIIRIISAPKLALLQMYITDREVDDLPILYISRSSELNETLITTLKLFLVMPDCKVILRLPPSENQKPFKIFYSGKLRSAVGRELGTNFL